VIPVPVLPRRRYEIGEPVEKLKRRELDDVGGPWPRGLSRATRADPAGGFVPGQHAADFGDAAVRTADHREPMKREGGPCAIPQEMFETPKVARHITIDERDPDTRVDREPAVLPGEHVGGSRVLAAEESLAFKLVTSLDEPQRKRAVIAAEAPDEIRGAGDRQPPAGPPAGIPFRDLSADQQSLVRQLVETYCGSMPAEVASERLAIIEKGSPAAAGLVHHGWDEIHFAWAGAVEPGKGHSYRLEGPSFVVEFVNVQPDAEGNPANHIHCVWRDKTGDFR
jgi:hypothetical protein